MGDLLELVNFLHTAIAKINGDYIELLPERLLSHEICLSAVENRGRALRFVPKQLKDYAICKAAVQESGLAFRFVPECYQTFELAAIAVLSSEVEDVQFIYRGSRDEVAKLKKIQKEHWLKQIRYQG